MGNGLEMTTKLDPTTVTGATSNCERGGYSSDAQARSIQDAGSVVADTITLADLGEFVTLPNRGQIRREVHRVLVLRIEADAGTAAPSRATLSAGGRWAKVIQLDGGDVAVCCVSMPPFEYGWSTPASDRKRLPWHEHQPCGDASGVAMRIG